jgi:predicted porin
MQKKLLALAVAGALAPAAAIAQSSVEIYGRANLGIQSWEASGATLGEAASFDRRLRVYDGSSRVGLRVNESLGGGLRAFVVIETGVNIDSGSAAGQSGTANTSSGFWASRDSYVGIGGGWGDIRFGRQSIFWSNGVIAQTGANYLDTAVDGLINNPSLTAIPVTRQSSVVSYNTPTVGGFNASISYSPHTQESAQAGADADGDVFGVTARYTSGAIRAQVDYAVAQGNSSAGVQTENTGWKVGLGWAYAPGSQISGIFGNYENENLTVTIPAGLGGGTLTGDAERTFWLLNWEHMIGQWQILAQYYSAEEAETDAGDLDDSDVRGITLGAKYFLSKRTGVYVAYHNVRNGEAAWADLNGGGMSSHSSGALTISNAGADVKIFAVGVMHNF